MTGAGLVRVLRSLDWWQRATVCLFLFWAVVLVAGKLVDPRAKVTPWVLALTFVAILVSGAKSLLPWLRQYRHENKELVAYLKALKRSLEPPEAIVGGEHPLSEVYEDQFLACVATNDAATSPAPLTFESVLSGAGGAIVEGGPGLGKSTLIDHTVVTLVDSFLKGHHPELIPVRVSAEHIAADATSLSGALRTAVQREIGHLLKDELRPNLFEDPPAAGTRWLIFVDALDRVGDQQRRKKLLEGLAYQSAQTNTYQFVVASRPLDELAGDAAQGFERFRLLALKPCQLASFARSWFGDESDRFVKEVERNRLSELGRIPLLLTLAARIYQADQGLPTMRTSLYTRLVTMLIDDESTRPALVARWRERYGEQGVTWADDIFKLRLALLEHLAHWRRTDHEGPFLDEAVRFISDRPSMAGVDAAWLRIEIRELLTAIRLLTGAAPQFSFLHDTIEEYLAACALVRTKPPGSGAGWQAITQWGEPEPRQIALFVLGRWAETGADTERILRRLLQADPDAFTFVGLAMVDGIDVGREPRRLAIASLADGCRRAHLGDITWDTIEILEALASAADVREAMVHVARDGSSDASVRLFIGTALARKEAPEAGDILWALVADRAAFLNLRKAAVVNIGLLVDRDKAIAYLHGNFTNAELDRNSRIDALDALAKLGRVDLVLTAARDASLDRGLRESTAGILSRIGAAKELLELVKDDDLQEAVRVSAAGALLRLEWRADVVSYLLRLARSNSVAREEAAHILVNAGDPDLLFQLLRDRRILPDYRVLAARLLFEKEGKTRLIQPVLGIARSRGETPYIRASAAEFLAVTVQAGDIRELTAILEEAARDARASQSLRGMIGDTLDALGCSSEAIAVRTLTEDSRN